MELYGLDIENMEGYKCAKEQLEQTYKTIDTYIEAVTNQSSEEFCENLGYILTDAVLYLYGPKGTKVAKNNFNKAIESGKKFFANFGEIGTESAKIVGLAGTEGVYRVEEALNILKQEGQVAKPQKLFGQVEKTVETSANAQINLDKKMRALEKAQREAVMIKELPDGRVRYYMKERSAKTPGVTKGSRHVTEFNPKTGQVRSWSECYDHNGKVNRVHPKMIDGQNIIGQHYPPTQTELNSFTKKSSE